MPQPLPTVVVQDDLVNVHEETVIFAPDAGSVGAV